MSQVTFLEPPPRTIKPRSRTPELLPVVAIAGQNFLTEEGEVGTVAEIAESLPRRSPTLFVVMGAAAFVSQLDDIWEQDCPGKWQWRASSHERDIIRPDGQCIATKVSTAIHYFGFKNGNFHKAIDPITMYGRSLNSIWPSDAPMLSRLLQWGIALRDFCADSNLTIKPTIGAISAQLLTDARFYPQPRRKVPAQTNARVREELPGNHYHLNVIPDVDNNFTALYLDQHRAHHFHARSLTFPNADYLYAFGRFQDLGECGLPDPIPGFHGLYCLDLQPPSPAPEFTWLTGYEKQFVYSNELTHLLDTGYVVTSVRAAWGSLYRDHGLNAIAEWNIEQLDKHGDAPWLKPLLLSVYGTLATRPKVIESIFRIAKAGDTVQLLTGKRRMRGKLARGRVKLEPATANVLHRGMIEAATRSESIGLAQWLTGLGHRVLSIYADGVIVEADDDSPLPLLPEPWRTKQELTHLQFINQQAFQSDGMTKLPGVHRDGIAYRNNRTPGYAPRMTDALGIVTERRI